MPEVLSPPQKSEDKNKNPDSKSAYKKYKNQVKKTKLLILTTHILSIFLIASLIFLPIYTYSYSPKNIDDLKNIENADQLEELIEKGTMDKNFSLWEDFIIVMSDLFSANNNKVMSLFFGLFAIFEVFSAAILICTTISQIMKNVNEIKEIDKTTLLLFTEIKKSGAAQKKGKFFKKQTAMTIVLYALFDMIFSTIDAELFKTMPRDMKPEIARHMISFTGVSPFISVAIVLLLGYFILNVFIKKREENLAIAIAIEDV